MRRFRPRSSKPGRLWPWFIVWVLLVIIYLAWVGWPKDHTKGATLNHAVTRSVAQISISYTGQTWHQKPVYILQNIGGNLEHVNIYNWAEDLLPVLYVGYRAPGDLAHRSAPANPPYSVPHHAKMWFVSSTLPPAMFTVTWDEQGNVKFTTVQVKDTPKTTVSSPRVIRASSTTR